MKKLIYLFLIFISTFTFGQTMIEMSNPNDADIVLLQVNDTADADVIIYFTEIRKEWEKWDCMWKIKKGGFSNFSFYLTQSKNDTLLFTDDTHLPIPIDGKVYFTLDKTIRGYKNDKIHINGIMKVKRNK